MSVEDRTGSVSSSDNAMTVAAARERRAKKLHALVDVQARANARQGQAQFDQRDGDGGPHADHDGLGVEDLRHRRDVAEHATDERVDDLERGDVDEHALRPIANDAIGEIVLQRHGQTVVHVDLDADQEELVHLEDRNALHARPYGFAVRVMLAPVRCSAMAKASASVALVITVLSSTPRWTMVCAICGRMPLMMQSAPMSRAAATVLSRCCATSVSTVGTPVMSMMAIDAPVSTIRCRRFSMTTCVRALSSVPISGSARMPSDSCTTGVDSSSMSCCWRRMISSRLFWWASVVKSASRSSSTVVCQISSASASASPPISVRRRSNSGCLSDITNVAVSD